MTRLAIPDVAPWPYDPGARSGGTHAARAVLRALGRDTSYDTLHVVSGAAFRWAYEGDDAFDARLDPAGPDPVADAFSAFGVTGSWRTDLPPEDLRHVVSASLRDGRPVVAMAVPGYPSGGVALIVGEDASRGRWLVQGTFEMGPREWNEGGAYWEMPMPGPWEAVVPGTRVVAESPVFVIGSVGPPSPDALSDAQARAAGAFAAAPYESLIEDVLLARRFGEGERLARLSGALEGLAHDRSAAARFLTAEPSRSRAGERFARTAEGALALRDRIVERVTEGDREPDALASRLDASRALALVVPGLAEEARDTLRDEGFDVKDTSFGPAVIADRPERRGMVARLAAEVRDLDEDAFAALA